MMGRSALNLIARSGRRLEIALGIITAVAALFVAASFWPGSIGWDYDIVLKEAALWSFRGHQPPAAGVFARVLNLGTAQPEPIFIVKVLAYFGAAIIVIFSRAPVLIRTGAVLIVLSPVFIYHSPLLRTNSIEAAFLGLAVALGVTGRSKTRTFLAFCSLVVAAMNSQALGPGHVGLIFLFLLWHYRGRSLGFHAVRGLATVVAAGTVLFTANALAGNPTRSSTLYVSALNGIGGLHERGRQICLSQELVRDSELSPSEILDQFYDHPNIPYPLWRQGDGLRPPLFLSEKQLAQVWSCWEAMAEANPVDFVLERAKIALASLVPEYDEFEQQFVFAREGPWLVLREDTEPSSLQTVIVRYGELGNSAYFGSVLSYLAVILLAGVIVSRRVRGRRLYVAVAAFTVVGFMAPQLLLAQSPGFRYYLVASHMCAWLTLTLGWLLVTETTQPAGSEDDASR